MLASIDCRRRRSAALTPAFAVPDLPIVAGSVFEIRPIRPQDAALIVAAAAYTSDETYYHRFRAVKRGFSAKELAYLTDVDGRSHCALVAVDRGSGRLAAVARYIQDPARPAEAELAVIVHDPFQHAGLGTVLVRALATHARAPAIDTFQVIIGNSNVAMHQLLRRVFPDARVRERDSYDTEYLASIPGRPGYQSPLLSSSRC